MTANQPTLFEVPSVPLLPEGFRYCPQAITAEDQTRLLAEIAGLPFKGFQFHGFEGKRRVVSFGWRYDFSEHKALPADPIPPFLRKVCENIQATTDSSSATWSRSWSRNMRRMPLECRIRCGP